MSCCQPTRKEFLETKLTNFRAFLEEHCSTDEERGIVASFSTVDSVMPYLLQAAALRAADAAKLEQSIASLESRFSKATDEAFKVKLRRYINMFRDVITS